MNRDALARLRSRLSARLHELRAEGDLAVDADNPDVQHKVDEDAAPLAEMSQVIASNRNRSRTRELREIEAALGRMRDDPEGFGLCDVCDDPIPVARLELMPWVKLCIDCQQADEGEHGRGQTRRNLTDYE